MCHGNKELSGKTVRFKTEKPRHKDAIPYKRQKFKDVKEYDE